MATFYWFNIVVLAIKVQKYFFYIIYLLLFFYLYCIFIVRMVLLFNWLYFRIYAEGV